jgi:hypothetical protein
MTNFINRNGSFNYSLFVKKLFATLEPGQVIHPRCVRETREYGNTDKIEKAEKRVKSRF